MKQKINVSRRGDRRILRERKVKKSKKSLKIKQKMGKDKNKK